jgi:peptidoglycan-associated lipoprotein
MLHRLARLIPLSSLVLLGLVGCKPDYPACKKDKHCNAEEGEKCVEGLCQNCTTNEDCVGKGENGENWVCHEFRCTDPAEVPGGAGGGEQGAPCTDTTACAPGLVCKAGICDVCMQDADCVTGTCNLDTGRCADAGTGGASCTTDDECAMDEICDSGMCVFSGDYGGDGAVMCDLPAVYFDFDSPKLKPEVEEQLKTAAQCIADQGRLVYLEAHADPRGTEEYNILLTDKRGQSVKSYLQNLGVTPENMQVISKGSLEATGTDESSWSQDRRVQFIWP